MIRDGISSIGTEKTDTLKGASLDAVLLYGLTLDDEDPALGVLFGARRELGLITSLAEASQPGMDFDLAEIVPVLEGIGRRLDVAIELITRAQRATMTGEPVGHVSKHDLDGTTHEGTGAP